MTPKQKQIIFELLRDNLSIYNEIIEIEDGILCDDEEFTTKCKNILDICYTIYINSIKNEMILMEALFQMGCLINNIVEERDDYSKHSLGYTFMNSFYDKTVEAFNELVNS